MQPPSPRVTPQVKAHLSVLLAALAAGQGGRLLAAAVRADRVEPGRGRRRHLHRRQRPAAGAEPAGADLAGGRGAVRRQHLPPGLDAAGPGRRPVGVRRRGRRRHLPAVRAALPGAAQRVGQGAARTSSATSRPRATPSTCGEVQPSSGSRPTTDADDGRPGRAPSPRSATSGCGTRRPSCRAQTFEQLQRIRNYYGIDDIDVDRYVIDGQPTQVNIGARTINPDGRPRRLVGVEPPRLHPRLRRGAGAVQRLARAASPSSSSATSRPRSTRRLADSGFELDQPGVYFGENLDGYVVVGTDRDEIDFQDEDDRPSSRRTTARTACRANSVVRRAAFALRFGDLNPLISDFMTDDSKVIFVRDVVDRVRALAPFLDADADPYPVVVDGRIIVDGRPVHDDVPLPLRAARPTPTSSPSGSGLDHDFNYVRNSVKATVDAYDGTVTLYVVDDDDPIVRAYADAFPDLFTDGRRDARRRCGTHLRYPEDLFRVQTAAVRPLPPDRPRQLLHAGGRLAGGPRPGHRRRRPDDTGHRQAGPGHRRAAGAPHRPLLPAAPAAPGRGGHAGRRRRDGADAAVRARTARTTAASSSPPSWPPAWTATTTASWSSTRCRRERPAADGPGIAAASISADEDVSVLREPAGHRRVRGAARQPAAGPHRQRAALRPAVLRGGRDEAASCRSSPGDRRVRRPGGDRGHARRRRSTSLFGQQAVTQEQPERHPDRGRGARPATRRRSDDTAPTGTAAEQAGDAAGRGRRRSSPRPTPALAERRPGRVTRTASTRPGPRSTRPIALLERRRRPTHRRRPRPRRPRHGRRGARTPA